MGNVNSVSTLLFVILMIISYSAYATSGNFMIFAVGFLFSLLISSAVRIANQWEKAVVLRLGRFHGLKGPGLFFIVL